MPDEQGQGLQWVQVESVILGAVVGNTWMQAWQDNAKSPYTKGLFDLVQKTLCLSIPLVCTTPTEFTMLSGPFWVNLEISFTTKSYVK